MSPGILMSKYTVLRACNTGMIFVEQEKVSNGAACVDDTMFPSLLSELFHRYKIGLMELLKY